MSWQMTENGILSREILFGARQLCACLPRCFHWVHLGKIRILQPMPCFNERFPPNCWFWKLISNIETPHFRTSFHLCKVKGCTTKYGLWNQTGEPWDENKSYWGGCVKKHELWEQKETTGGWKHQARETKESRGKKEWQNKHCLKNLIVKPTVLCKIIKTNEKEAKISTSSLKWKCRGWWQDARTNTDPSDGISDANWSLSVIY